MWAFNDPKSGRLTWGWRREAENILWGGNASWRVLHRLASEEPRHPAAGELIQQMLREAYAANEGGSR